MEFLKQELSKNLNKNSKNYKNLSKKSKNLI